MKFFNVLDVQTFLLELKEFDKIHEIKSHEYVPTKEEMSSFIKARTPLVNKLKNYRKSADSKANWRANRTKMMKGIKAFHRSVEGKRFHRRLGNFIASRITRDKTRNEDLQSLLFKQGYLKGLNSVKQHLFVELEYFHQLEEQIDLEDMIIDYALPMFRVIETKIINDEELTSDELVFLMDLTENNALIDSIAQKTNKEFAEIENLWNSIASDLEMDNISTSDAEFYPILIDRLKKELGLTDNE